MAREGLARAMLLGVVTAPPETPVAGSWRVRVSCTTRIVERGASTKVERTDWFWARGVGSAPLLAKGDLVLIDAELRSLHEPGPPPREETLIVVSRLITVLKGT